MKEFLRDNRKHWEELAELHPETDCYNVEGFLGGESTLDPIEPDELGDVEGDSLLHLQSFEAKAPEFSRGMKPTPRRHVDGVGVRRRGAESEVRRRALRGGR